MASEGVLGRRGREGDGPVCGVLGGRGKEGGG